MDTVRSGGYYNPHIDKVASVVYQPHNRQEAVRQRKIQKGTYATQPFISVQNKDKECEDKDEKLNEVHGAHGSFKCSCSVCAH